MKLLLLAFVILAGLFAGECSAQNSRYIIRFKDKGSNTFSLANPLQYLSPAAIDRRTRYNITIDSTDLPISASYIDSLRSAGGVTILNSSKWLNQVAIKTTDAGAIAKINSFPFVLSSTAVASRFSDVPVNKKLDGPDASAGIDGTAINAFTSSVPYYSYGKSNGQVKIHNGDFLHNHGFRGEGMKMTILDAGFYHYLSLTTFDSMRLNNQVLGTWDFVGNETSVDEDDAHGMECLSTIAANLPGTFVGTAPKTSFYLYRTEDVSSETQIEEQNWAAGIERADSLGVPVSSTSLGYYAFDSPSLSYTYAQLDGNTTISARAADFAAKKGMLLVIAAGNEGNSAWHYIITPADADSVLAVGAVDTLSRVAGFSSYGPSSDGRVKPSVAAVGLRAYVANPFSGLPMASNGTSFACPNMAGLATCLWQAFPEVNNMSIIDVLEKSGSKANNPDDRIGYGIPDMKKAFVMLVKKLFTKQSTVANCVTNYNFKVKLGAGMTIDLQRKKPSEISYTTLQTYTGSSNFIETNLSYQDDLSDVGNNAVGYRLIMNIDTDTSFTLDSSSVSITGCTALINDITIGPNPVQSQLSITVQRATAAQIGIVVNNGAGQQIFSKSFQQQVGVANEIIPMLGLSKGVYFVSVFVNGKKVVTKQVLK